MVQNYYKVLRHVAVFLHYPQDAYKIYKLRLRITETIKYSNMSFR